MCDSVGGVHVGASVSRQGEFVCDDDSATTVTSPAGSSCGSLTESDLFTGGVAGGGLLPLRHCSHGQEDFDSEQNTLKSDYAPPPRPSEDSWKALTQHVIGGGYQIRPPPQRVHEYSPSDVDDYR